MDASREELLLLERGLRPVEADVIVARGVCDSAGCAVIVCGRTYE